MIISLIWRNIWRNKRRTFITISSIAFAMVFSIVMQSIKEGAFDNLIKNLVGYYSGYIQIHKAGYWKEKVIENSFMVDSTLFTSLSNVKGIHCIIPRLESFTLISTGNTTKGCVIIGTDPQSEADMTKLNQKIIKGSYFTANSKKVLLAEGIANSLHASIGDTIILFGQGFHGSMAAGKYQLGGILHFNAPQMNNQFMYIPLREAQELFSAESRVSSIAISIHDSYNMYSIQHIIHAFVNQEYEVMNWEEMLPEISNHIESDTISMSIFTGVLYLMIGFGFFGTIVMMISERKREFGMLIAIGMKKKLIQFMLTGETIIISVFGALIGIVISLPIVLYMKEHPIRFTGDFEKAFIQFGFEPIFPTIFNPSIFFTQTVIVLILSIIVGIYPIWHIHRINELQAMR